MKPGPRVLRTLLLAAACAWVWLIADPALDRCAARMSGGAMAGGASLPEALRMFLAMNPPGAWALGWAAMLVATMLPTLTAPLCHVWRQSFARRRGRTVALFLAGYGAVWLAAGALLTGLALVLAWATPWAGVAACAAALVWQASPAKQRCLNRGHAHPVLAAFGEAADRSALRFGATHGVWCVGSCWTWMLLPMLPPRGRLLAMAAVGGLIFCERLELPARPGWKMRGMGRAVRMLLARVRVIVANPNKKQVLRFAQDDRLIE